MLKTTFTSKRELIRPRPGRELHPQRLIALGCVFLVALVTLATFSLVTAQRQRALEEARTSLRNAALALAQQTDHVFNAVDMVEGQVADQLTLWGISSAELLRRDGASAHVHEMLTRSAAALPFPITLTIADDQSTLVSSSLAWPAPDAAVTAPEIANLLKSSGFAKVIAATQQRRREGAVQIARRLSGTDGQVSGLLVGSVAAGYLEKIYRGILLPAGSSVSLYRGDGSLLASTSQPVPSDPARSQYVADLFEASPKIAEEAQTSTWNAADGSNLIAGAARLTQDPLLIVASSPVNTVLSAWRKETAAIALIAAFLNIAIIVAAFLGMRQLRAGEVLVETLSESARRDSLTGLANQAMFHEDLDRAIARSERTKQKFSVILLDLDHLKEVNDTQGYQVGDELLQAVTGRMRREIRRSDVLARLDGDQFAVIQWNVSGPEDTAALAERLVKRLCEPFTLRKFKAVVGVRIGAALAPRDGLDADALLKHAELALEKSKANGRHSVCFFSESMRAEHLQRRAFAADLRQAFANRELELVFQPILNIETRQIASFETLLRWHHPERGTVSPNEFIPVAEETGLIGPLGGWVLTEACRQAALWPSNVRVAVNLSPVQMQTHDIYVQVSEALQHSSLAPERLEIEITESVAVEHTDAGKALTKLRRLGVGVSLDDFGTGYASLSYLRSFPFDRIKIDQSFVKDMHRQTESAAIVQTVIDLARRLGIVVTAEGVETVDQLEKLRTLGCQKAQGYLIGPALPAREIREFLAAWPAPGFAEARPVLVVSN